MIPFSILDLAPIPAGHTVGEALRNTLDLAQHAERWGYRRYWLAEHHGMPGIASAATAVVIGHVAAGTQSITLGSGGVMLPNHAPLVIAEQFGTLAALHPGRIELGLGRAPGTDVQTTLALRRDMGHRTSDFPRDVVELQHYFAPAAPGQKIRAIPGEGERVPLWLLGSSTFSAELAAQLGLPFAFAAHFAPGEMNNALYVYRSTFEPSAQLAEPYAMLCVNLFAAPTDAEARFHFTSLQQAFLNLRRDQAGPVPAPVEDIKTVCNPLELANVEQALRWSFVGSPETVIPALADFLNTAKPDELMLAGHFHDHAARLRSFELGMQIRSSLAEKT